MRSDDGMADDGMFVNDDEVTVTSVVVTDRV